MGKEEIFNALKKELSAFSPLLEVTKDLESNYELYGTKSVTVGKKTVDKMYFASAIIQKNFVGFYFFPIYTHRQEFNDTPQELQKCLKGKSCFHIKKNDEQLIQQIRDILKKGKEVYQKAGWI
ncbi:MAG: hypothetical protein COA57_05240 [Flavobacteriales bacterium]|nr:hypothetical protein [Bacteroidales bacterium AH-315-I05]PCJ87084.1 MAG: hypothetical protein COA57_05240 [Flavobacteriales bacterium]